MGRHSYPDQELPRFSSLAERLARECARGVRQRAFVNELLAGSARRRHIAIPGSYPTKAAYVYGYSRLDHQSFLNLRRRLTAAGFIVHTPHHSTVTVPIHLTFPEEEA